MQNYTIVTVTFSKHWGHHSVVFCIFLRFFLVLFGPGYPGYKIVSLCRCIYRLRRICRLIQDRQHGHNLRSATTTLCQPSPERWLLRSALTDALLWLFGTHYRKLSLIVTVTVFKSRLKIFLFPGLSLFPLLSCILPGPSTMKLQPYGAVQICLLL